jgi:uncharacterized protein DUF3592
MMRSVLIIVVTWLIFASLFFIGSLFALDAVKYCKLTTQGVQTSGLVIAKEPENHFFIRYSYTVNGQTFEGLGSAGRGNPKFEDIKTGDLLRVYYDPSDPGSSLLGNPNVQFASIKRGVVFITLLGATFCVFGLWAKGWLPGLRDKARVGQDLRNHR